MEKGIFYSVGVGPGDPELITRKAMRIIEECPVIAVPRTRGENTLALSIAQQSCSMEGKELFYMDFPMSRDPKVTADNHVRLTSEAAAYLEAGKSIACLTIGDPSLYSTATYIGARLQDKGYETAVIPGIPAMCACAAVLKRDLTDMKQPLHVFPASFADLEASLDMPGGKVLMKSGSALPEVRRMIEEKGLSEKAAAVANCGLPDEKVFESLDGVDASGYFTTILIRP